MPRRGRKKYRKRKNPKKNANEGKVILPRGNPNTPLMPDQRLIRMRYTERVLIDPPQVASGNLETSSNLVLQTFYTNNLYDVNLTHTTAQHTGDGHPNHQPRMYDQWSQFYNQMTVVGSHISVKAINQRRLQSVSDDASTPTITNVVLYDPVYVGILKNRRNITDEQGPTLKYDDILEKKMAHIRLLKGGHQGGQPVTVSSGWSLKKEPTHKYNIKMGNDDSDTSWGAEYGHDVPGTQRRYYHIFAHPALMTDNENPKPVTCEVTIDYTVLLSDLKDIAMSS